MDKAELTGSMLIARTTMLTFRVEPDRRKALRSDVETSPSLARLFGIESDPLMLPGNGTLVGKGDTS